MSGSVVKAAAVDHVFLQIDLLGKGGPASIEEHEVEYDVRLVHVNVTGVPIVDLEISEGILPSLSVSDKDDAEENGRMQQSSQSAPRFDSSDSDDSDFWEESDYLDSFI